MSGNSRARSVWQARTVMMAVDVVLINVAFVLAYAIRYDLELGGAVDGARSHGARGYRPGEQVSGPAALTRDTS